MTLPEGNIEWTKIQSTDDVELRGHAYVVNGEAVACWCSRTARAARIRLDNLVRLTEARRALKQGS